MIALDPRIRGCVPALVTPATPRGEPDNAGMARLVDHVAGAGADAMVVLGSTGEFSVIPPAFRRPILEAAAAASAGRLPMIVGCGRPSIAETIAEIAEAADCGAAAALVTPSYYFPLSDEEIAAFFRAVAKDAPIPLLYYHYPEMTGCRIGVPTLVQLVEDGSICGLKDSGGDAAFFARLAAATCDHPDFRLFVGGSAFLLAALALGAHGVTGALGNFALHLDRALLDAHSSGDADGARAAQAAIVRANAAFFAMPRNAAAITKAALAALGICGAETFPPIDGLTAAEHTLIRSGLAELGLKTIA